MPRARVHWEASALDLENIRRAQRIWLSELAREGINVEPLVTDDDDRWMAAIAGGAHHMGTTRMHRAAALGVVDEECRVHSTTNLFVAGSSVFPTGGWAPPTLTIIALALRLADHVKNRLTSGRIPR